jgi:hypothetical protein
MELGRFTIFPFKSEFFYQTRLAENGFAGKLQKSYDFPMPAVINPTTTTIVEMLLVGVPRVLEIGKTTANPYSERLMKELNVSCHHEIVRDVVDKGMVG